MLNMIINSVDQSQTWFCLIMSRPISPNGQFSFPPSPPPYQLGTSGHPTFACLHTLPQREWENTPLLCLIELHCMERAFQSHIMWLGNCHAFANNDKMWPGLLLTATTAHCMLIKLVGKTGWKGQYKPTGISGRPENQPTSKLGNMGIFVSNIHACGNIVLEAIWKYLSERTPCMLGMVVLEAVSNLEGSVENRERNCTQTHSKKPQNNLISTSNSQRQPFMGEIASNRSPKDKQTATDGD